MATYRIYFFGLVMHIEQNGKGHSAVLHDSEHEARLMFGEYDEVDLTGIHLVEIVADDLQWAPAVRMPSFGFVPDALTILGGTLKQAAAQGSGSDATFVHHVGGSLHTARLYEREGAYWRDAQPHVPAKCVTMLTLMLIESSRPVFIKAGPVTRRISESDCVLLANFDRDIEGHNGDQHPHVRKYSKLIDHPSMTITMKTDSDCSGFVVPPDEPCDWITRVISNRGTHTAAHPECGNSAWP